jgi:hypothetical protein
VVKVPQEVPEETAGERCEELTGRPLRAHTAHEVPHTVAAGCGVWEVAPSQEAIAARIAAGAVGQVWRPILGLALAGAEVPPRPETAPGRRPGRQQTRAQRARWTGAWREANGCRGSRLAAERIVQGWSWPHVPTDEALAAALQQVQAAGWRPEPAVRRWVRGEGAPWLWPPGHRLCPTAVALVDDAHGRAHLHTVAARPYGAHPERPQAWYEAARARLLGGDVHGVIWGRQRMKPTEAQAATELTPRVRSLQEHQERLDSHWARQGGSPLGRGGLNRRTRASVMGASSVPGLGGRYPTRTRGWPCAARNTMAPLTKSLRATGKECRNHQTESLLKNKACTHY